MRAKGIVSLSLALALCATPALAQSPANVIQLDFKADVQADGVPANIQPDASLAPPLQAMVRKRVAEWRYRMGTWQGKPVPAPVSQRIVAEVMLGLIEGDRTSYLSQDPTWEPTLPTIGGARDGEDFHMIDLLKFAGVA